VFNLARVDQGRYILGCAAREASVSVALIDSGVLVIEWVTKVDAVQHRDAAWAPDHIVGAVLKRWISRSTALAPAA
jgi:hypothetical protein